MQFSEQTINVLKNFATITPSLVFEPGKVLKVITSPVKSIMAVADIEEEIPGPAAVYDMSRFLATLALYDKPEIEFGDKMFTFREGKRKNTYVYAERSMVVGAPKNEPKFPTADVEVTVPWTELQTVLRASSVLQLPEIAFVGQEGKVYVRAIDHKNPTADFFGSEVGETDDEFSLIVKTEYLKLLPLDYKVELSARGISRFTGTNVRYYIALEEDSKYSKGGE